MKGCDHMAKGNYIKGITVVIGGDTSDLQKSLKDVDAQIKSTENELKTVERLLKIDPKNTDLLAKKQQLLNSEIETTKNKLNSLKQAKEKADKTMKDGNADQLKAYTQLREEIQKTEQKLKNLEQASSKFTQTGEKLQSVGNKMTDVGQKGMVLTGAITALGAGVAASAESTREYREDMSRLEAAFVSAGKTTEAAKQIYDDFYVILGESDRSVEAVNHLAKLCNSEQELADWSTICAGVSATFGDSLPIEGLTEAANETAKVSKVTGPLADALNWAGVSEDDFNTKLEQCNSEQERSKLITSTLTELYKEAAAQFKENNADVIANREATQMWNDELAKLGATVEPVLTALREKVAELLSWFNNLTDGQKKTLAATLALTAAIPPLLVGTGNVITSIGTVTKSLSSCKGQVTKLFALISAHPLGALLTAVTALTVGLGAYAYANDETAQKVRELTNESKNLIKESDELINSANQTEASLAAQKDTVNSLIDRLYELEGQDGKTTEAKNEMHSIVNQLNSLIPSLNLSINEETGLLNMQSGTVKQLANDYINLAYAKAYANKITEASEKIIGLQTSNKDIEQQIEETSSKKVNNRISTSSRGRGGLALLNLATNIENTSLQKSLNANNAEIDKLNANIDEWSKNLAGLQTNIAAATTTAGNGLKTVGSGIKSTGATAGKTAKSATKTVETEAEKQKKIFDEELKTLKEDLSFGFISQQDYYAKLAEMRDYYLEKGSSDWWTYTKEIIAYERDKANELKDIMADVAENVQSTTEEYLNKRKQLTESFENALKPDGLYDTVVFTSGENQIEMNSLTDWSDKIARIDEFNAKLETGTGRLKKFFGDDEDGLNKILDTIRESPYGEGGKLLDLIGKADDDELKKYVEGFQEYNAKAKSTAEHSYSDELDDISENFNLEINKIIEDIPEEFAKIGKSAGELFSKGFTEQLSSVLASLQSILSINFGALGGTSGVTNNSVNNSRTNNVNVNVANTGPQIDAGTLARQITNAIWLGGEL